MRAEVGTRVLLRADHPWAGHVGTVLGYEYLQGAYRPRIGLDNGFEVFVVDDSQWTKA